MQYLTSSRREVQNNNSSVIKLVFGSVLRLKPRLSLQAALSTTVQQQICEVIGAIDAFMHGVVLPRNPCSRVDDVFYNWLRRC